jgi:hypothetical protein
LFAPPAERQLGEPPSLRMPRVLGFDFWLGNLNLRKPASKSRSHLR